MFLMEFPFITFRGDKNVFFDFEGAPTRKKNGNVWGRTGLHRNQEAKAAAMARLVMGIAHGINNPLATNSHPPT
jgi:anti-sigma-K factor RskA